MGSERHRRSIAIALVLAAFALQGFHLYGTLFAQKAQGPPTSPLKGICLSGGYTSLGQVAELNVSRALDWGVSLDTARGLKEFGIEYHPRALMDNPKSLPTDGVFRAKVEPLASEFPGTTWLFYNEPELNCQHPVSPQWAVELFDQMSAIILAIDPTARFVIGNTTFECWVNPEGEDGGAAWLKQFVQHYRDSHGGQYPPVLGYGLHLYADCCEWGDDGDGYMDYLDRAARFVENLHTGAEMWVTEWGWLLPNGQPIDQAMEIGSFWFEGHGIPYFWYATYTYGTPWCPHCEGALMENGELTALGELYRELPRPMQRVFLPGLQN